MTLKCFDDKRNWYEENLSHAYGYEWLEVICIDSSLESISSVEISDVEENASVMVNKSENFVIFNDNATDGFTLGNKNEDIVPAVTLMVKKQYVKKS